jgi:hypothetical protein
MDAGKLAIHITTDIDQSVLPLPAAMAAAS